MRSSQVENPSVNDETELNDLSEQFVKNPLDAGLCDRIGALYLRLKKYPEARAYIEKAIQLKSDLQSATHHLSVLATMEETSLKSANVPHPNPKKFDNLHSYESQQTILFIGDFLYPPVGGAEKSALTLLQEMIQDGHRCFAVCKGRGADTVHNEIRIRYLSHPDLIEHTIFQIKPSLIITQLNWAYFGVALAKKHHIPSILFVRSYEYFCATTEKFDICDRNCLFCTVHPFNRTIKEKFRSTIEDTTEVVCNSEFMRKVTLDFYGRDSHVVYPTMALDEHDVQRDIGTFIVMNQPQQHKGGSLFFELAQKMPDLRFMTVGRGDQIKLSNCTCYGQTSPLIFLKYAQLFLVPSFWPEPFGRVAVEAMRNGIPVIASKCGGLPEILGDAGILINNYRSVDEWEKAVRLILDDKKMYESLSKKSKERSSMFDCETQIQRIRPIINAALDLTSNSTDRRVLNFYNKQYETAATYALLFNHRRERLEGLCNLVKPGEFFLDIGCADGAHMEVLYQRKNVGIGIDVSVPNVIRGRKHFPHLNFIHGFAEMIPFPCDFFDVVIMGDVLEHLRNPKTVIKEVFRVAKSLAICVPIGERTLEHISPYPTVNSVVELFDDVDVSLQWFTFAGKTIPFNEVIVTESKPWVYLRVQRKNDISENKIVDHSQSSDSEDSTVLVENVRDEWDGRTISRDFQEVIRFHSTAQIVEGPNVLEMACGNGDMSVVIAKKEGVSLHGIDIMSKGIERARKTAQAQLIADKVTFEIRDASNSKYPDNFFDTVIIPELIEHIKDPHRIIMEALRVTKPGGLILVSVPDGPDPNPDNIRCFFRETLRIELAQFTGEITWHRLPFRRWLIGTFRKEKMDFWMKKSPLEKILNVKDCEQAAPVPAFPPLGFNIVGPIGAGNEFGARVRGLIQSLLECGYPVAVWEVPVDGQQSSVNQFRLPTCTGEALPYSINLFCLHPLMMNRIFSSAPFWLQLNNRLNVCLPDISSSVASDTWFTQLNRMDSIIVLNTEIELLVKKNNPGISVITMEIAPYNHKKGYFQRVNFGFAEDVVLFVSYVDMQLSPLLQNVDCIIKAFRKLEYLNCTLALVLDCTVGVNHEYLQLIKNTIQDDVRIRLYEGVLGREDIQSLFDIADFGINCSPLNSPSPWTLEMMSNGKCVISLSLLSHEKWIHLETAWCVPAEYVTGTQMNSFRTVQPEGIALYDTLKMCCNNPQLCKERGTVAKLRILSMRELFRSGGGAHIVESFEKCITSKTGKNNFTHFSLETEPSTEQEKITHQLVTSAKFMEEVTRLVEQRKFKEAVVLYEVQRPHVQHVPELVKFDELMRKVKHSVQ